MQVTLGRLNQLTTLPYTSSRLVSPGFHVMPFYCSFATTACGGPIAFNANSNKPGYRIGTWGGLLTLHPGGHWYVKAGVIENEPVESTEIGSNEGWPGRDWGFNQANGAYLPVQLGYITSPQGRRLPDIRSRRGILRHGRLSGQVLQRIRTVHRALPGRAADGQQGGGNLRRIPADGCPASTATRKVSAASPCSRRATGTSRASSRISSSTSPASPSRDRSRSVRRTASTSCSITRSSIHDRRPFARRWPRRTDRPTSCERSPASS